MNKKLTEIKITRCGPGDVSKEIAITGEVITEWNQQHWDALNCALKHQHWSTDSSPDMSDRGQGVINRQIIDDSDVVVAVFWERFGSPTGFAQSGTEEEIRRAIARGIRVMLYFSDLEKPTSTPDPTQVQKLQAFRAEMQKAGLAFSFKSRKEFKDLFRIHLAKTVHELRERNTSEKRDEPKVKATRQTAKGKGNILIAGNGNTATIYENPPRQKIVVERAANFISPKECLRIKEIIDELVGATMGKTQSDAYRDWWSYLYKNFNVAKYEMLTTEQMPLVEKWFTQQRAMLTRKQKTKAPDSWRRRREIAIKAAMGTMNKENEDYYPEISRRLKMKKPFASLSDLTKIDLDRVYNMVMGDKAKS